MELLIGGVQSNPWLHYATSVILLFFNSLLLQSLASNTGIQPRSTHLSAAVYILSMGCVLSPNMVVGFLFGSLFCLLAIHSLHRLETAHNEVSPSFFSGFLLSLAVLFQPLLLVLLVFFLYKSLSLRWSLVKISYLLLLGLLIPLYFIWTAYFLWDNGYLLFTELRDLFALELHLNLSASYLIVLIGPFLLIAVFGGWSMFGADTWKNVMPRSWLTFWWTSALLLTVMGRATMGLSEGLAFLCLPIGVSLPYFILAPKKKKLRRAVFTLMFFLAQLQLLYLSGLIVPF